MLKSAQLLLPFVFALMTYVDAEAQLFGSRSLGQPLQRRAGPGSSSQAGQLQGGERFLRGNRGRAEFVGSDQREQQGFVGSEQARTTGAVGSSVAGLRQRTDRSSQINRPLALSKANEMYPPQLQLGFSLPERELTELGTHLAEELQGSSRFSAQCRFEVSVAGRTAILRGEVTSVRERDLAELVARIEPGISSVRNELLVATPLLPQLPVPEAQDSR
ncbi:MAG: BON domain-containing protein [Planctomycetes bacterium]|nr:BON domain-containing protein [Planctomycetota bacterium]